MRWAMKPSLWEKQMTATQSFVIDFIHGVNYLCPCQLIELFHLTVIRSGFARLPHSIGWKYFRQFVNRPEVESSLEWLMVAIVLCNWAEWLQSTIHWSRDTRLCGCSSTHHPTVRQILWRYWINSTKIYQQDWGGGRKEQFLYDSYSYKWREILPDEINNNKWIVAVRLWQLLYNRLLLTCF